MNELYQEFVVIFLGGFIGIPAGFALQSLIDKFKDKKERNMLLELIKMNLQKNKGLIEQIKDELSITGNVIYYPLDLVAWP